MKEVHKQNLKSIASKTFGGLNKEYYFRNFLFGLVIFSFFFFTMKNKPSSFWLLFIPNLFLYPYSRFVYESIVEFIIGENRFWTHTGIFLAVKTTTIFLCFMFAVIVAPVGLLYLYFYHTKKEKMVDEE